jgi:hypothetical protein
VSLFRCQVERAIPSLDGKYLNNVVWTAVKSEAAFDVSAWPRKSIDEQSTSTALLGLRPP